LPICKYLEKITNEHVPNQKTDIFFEGVDATRWYKVNGMKLKHPCVGLVQYANWWGKTSEMLILKKVLEKLPDVQFYWVGHGPFEERILTELEKYENFHWLGKLEYPDKVREFLSEIDIYALITGMDLSSLSLKEAQLLKKIISTDYYSTEISNDIQGVEISGAIKNIYSMLIGAAEGLSNSKAPIEIQSKYYLNTSASLIHRSISEMVEFVSYYGGKPETVYGLAGLGDLYVSAIGGRNSLMGKYLGQGHLYKDAKELYMKNITVEGAELAFEIGPKILKELKEKEFPLMFSVLKSICENKNLKINW